ncbi:protein DETOXIFICATION 53 [Mercurialis annua]|uniref:protein DETOXIFICATION 53 n=1 Tax=Mercurialis annua TaxID=3986 RepID=UPI002160B55B|nr:protein DETOXIFICATION 53 [Mercurialis annua]
MCPGAADTESRGIINGENLVSKDADYDYDDDDDEETMRSRGEAKFLQRLLPRLPLTSNLGQLPLNDVGEEMYALGKIACPIVLTTMLLYSRSVISMLFLSRIGENELAGGSLALGFANITGFSVMKGLAMGMDPICGQAYGAKRWSLLSQTYLKTLILLLLVAIPISILWLNVEPIFLRLGQDPDITNVAKVYMVFCIPELLAQAVLHPMRSFLRTQGLTAPLTVSAVIAVILHTPINYFFAVYLKLGVRGVALALACNTVNMNIGLLIYVAVSKTPLKPWHGITAPSVFYGWRPLLSLAVPTVVSVCLEWWWYEIMLFLCGLLPNPKASVAATGILIQTAGLIYSFPYSLSCSLSTRVGHALGAGQPTRAKLIAVIGILLGFTAGFTSAVFTAACRSFWGKMYTNEPQILELISTGLPLLGLCEIGNSPQTAACGVLTGTARTKDGARINLYAFYLVGLPVAILLTFKLKMGFQGLWFGLLAAQMCCVSMMLYSVFQTDWRHQAKRADELTSAAGERNDLENGLLLTDQ